MKVTFILENKSDEFYNGSTFAGTGLLQQSPLEQFERLEKQEHNGLVKMKVGDGSFRDRVEHNQIRRRGTVPAFKLEPRKGYKLATFTY